MNEIEVGEYVRTDRGVIYKYTEEERDDILLQDFRLFNDGKISKHSKELIDLVEEGDYVNGEKVTGIMSGYAYLDKIDIETRKVKTLTDYQVKSIVTKEQFKSVEYIVKE